jgi:membrane protein implicated in regulation of membrane protease activity
VSWLDVADIFGPSFVLTSVGYRVVVVAGFLLWRPQIALLAAAILGATLVFRILTILRLAGPVKRILGMSVGADAIVVDAPKRGDVVVQVGGVLAPALELSRDPRRPKVASTWACS